jgi:hypothetical protein
MRRAAFALLLFAAACSHDVATAPPAQPARHPVAATGAPQFALVDPLEVHGGAASVRSVFAYREASREVAKSRGREVAAVATELPNNSATEKPSDIATSGHRDPGPFPYRAIGRFGPDDGQLVAFIVDGEVKLARAGEVLAERYIVRAVGIESVEVALLSAPETRWILELGK